MSFISDFSVFEHFQLLTDSRYLSDPSSTIFVAIKGQRHDGHIFIEALLQRGISKFIVETEALTPSLRTLLEKPEILAIECPNAILAIQQMAKSKRSSFQYPVIGITGSNGKTIVKEWIWSLLHQQLKIVRSPNSYNSQIGVALSIWEMKAEHQLGLFEAGISQPDEMQKLQEIIQPEIGIFTNIGTAHSAGFRSNKQKISEKLRLFRQSKILIYCRDHEEVHEEIQILLKAVNPTINLVGWSMEDLKIQVKGKNTEVQLTFQNNTHQLALPFTDEASIENAIHAIYAILLLKYKYFETLDLAQIFEHFSLLQPVSMRLELKQGINQNYLIDDTYNNDLGGLKMAFHFMNQNHTKRHKTLILSDMEQYGHDEDLWIEQTKKMILTQNLHFFIGIGPVFVAHKEALGGLSQKSPRFFTSTQDFLQNFDFQSINESLILVKGARSFQFEKIVALFIKQVQGTVFEIKLNAITHNLNFYRNKIGPKTKIMVMVKAFAYGSGSSEVAALLQYHRVDYLSVAYTDEGISLRREGITLPIMVLNSSLDAFQKLFEFDLEPEIYSAEQLSDFVDFKNQYYPEKRIKIHIKLDTGMHRLGFIESDLPKLTHTLADNPTIMVASIFSHLVGADEPTHNEYSKTQIKNFEDMSNALAATMYPKPLRHICNSAGIIRFPEAKYDMVRLGIGLYGVEASNLEANALETVGTLKTTISQIKSLEAGQTVGYSRMGVLDKPSRIATIAIGYADGYDRRFSRGIGKINVNGTMCPVVGNVCMDMTMIDVTEAKCEVGDQVIVFGKNPTIFELAKSIGTISYELLTNVGERVKRVFYAD